MAGSPCPGPGENGFGADAVKTGAAEALITDFDLYLFGEGKHTRIYDKLGAHPVTSDGAAGYHFAVWAPSADRVNVVGDFNGWDGRSHPLRPLGASGIWGGFVPNVTIGQRYKFELFTRYGARMLKADPY